MVGNRDVASGERGSSRLRPQRRESRDYSAGCATDALATLKTMVTIALIAAAVLIAALGVAHSILGEKHIINWLLTHDLPRLFGGTSFTAGTIRFAWHITTVLFLGLASVVLVVALGATAATVLVVIGVTFLLSAVLPIWFTRGRHISWVILVVAGGLCFWGAAGI